MDYAKDFLKSSDFFGRSVKLMFSNESKFTTVFGGLLSLAIFGLTLSLILEQSNSLIKRKKVVTNSMNLYQKSAPLTSLNDGKLTGFSYQFLDRNFQAFYDESYFKFEIFFFEILHTKTGNTTIQLKPIVLSNCSDEIDLFINENYNFTSEFYSTQQTLSYCLKNRSLVTGGSFSSEYFGNIQLSIKKCNNKTSNIICKPLNDINSKISGGYFEFYFVDRFVNEENLEKPLETYFNTYFTKMDPFGLISSDFYFKQVNVTSDVGFIFEDYNYVNGVMFDRFREIYSTDRSNDPDTIMNFYVQSSNNILKINRKYMKFQDLAATIGGIFQTFVIFGRMISFHFNKYKMWEKIMNTLYEFNLDEKEDSGGLVVSKKQTSMYYKVMEKRKSSSDEVKFKEENKHSENINSDQKDSESNLNKESEVMQHIFIPEPSKQDSFTNNINNLMKIENLNIEKSSSENKNKLDSQKLILQIRNISNNLSQNQKIEKTYHNKNPSNNDIFRYPVNNKNNSSINYFFDGKDIENKRISNTNLITNKQKNNIDCLLSLSDKIRIFNDEIAKTPDFHNDEINIIDNHKVNRTQIINNTPEVSNDKISQNVVTKKEFKRQTTFDQLKLLGKHKKTTFNKKLFYMELMKKIEEYKQTRKASIIIGYLDIIGILFCRTCSKNYSIKYTLIHKGYDEMRKYLDYLDIIKLLQEFTKLKLILLSDRQLNLFSFISKPQILFNEKHQKNSYLHGKIFEKNNISLQNLYQLFVETIELEDKTIIDERIIENLDDDLKDTFEVALEKTKQLLMQLEPDNHPN